MSELIPREKGSPGRVRTVTASAWIARRHAGGNYHSHVYVGKGRVQVLSTHTAERTKALEFNRCHLIQSLKSNADSVIAQEGSLCQSDLLPMESFNADVDASPPLTRQDHAKR